MHARLIGFDFAKESLRPQKKGVGIFAAIQSGYPS